MYKLNAQILGLTLFSAFVQFVEAESGPAPNLLDQKDSFQQNAQRDKNEKISIAETMRIVTKIVEKSYPELRDAQISVKTFESRSDYFRSSFSVSRFLSFRKLHYTIFVAPRVFEKKAPPTGIRAIIAHELAHTAYYRRQNRFELFGLVALRSNSFTARIERGADLQAIKSGYGAGLRNYREWLYQNIPAEQIARKKRDYFSPEEIELIVEAVKEKPDLIDFWMKNVPRNSAEIESPIKSRKFNEK